MVICGAIGAIATFYFSDDLSQFAPRKSTGLNDLKNLSDEEKKELYEKHKEKIESLKNLIDTE